MNNQNYETTFTVKSSSEEVFKAINNIRGWWSEVVEGNLDTLGDELNYTGIDSTANQVVHKCKLKVTEFKPFNRIVWTVLENEFTFTKDKTEWTGTNLIFEITQNENDCTLKFTHDGLTPAYECYDICNNAWNFYINTSLKNYITTGKGQPNKDKAHA